MFARLIFAVAVASAAALAHADPLEEYSDDPLAACVAAANGERAPVRACVGVAAWPCIDEGEGATQMRTLCWSNEQSWWMQRAHDVAAELETRDPERMEPLHAATAAFEAFVERECAYRGAAFQGGSGMQPAMVQCAAELWAERFIMLDETLADY